jgi:hypothetical protein
MYKFVPPKEESKTFPRYASYGAGILKTHSQVGHAKLSLRNRVTSRDNSDPSLKYWQRPTVWSHSFILENVDGEYFTLYEIPDGTKEEELPWMKEFYIPMESWDSPRLMTDYMRGSSYHQRKLQEGSARLEKRPVPMTTDEYVAWRLGVERERLGIG